MGEWLHSETPTELPMLLELIPPLVAPVRALPLALACAYLPHFYKGALVYTSVGEYDLVHPRSNVATAQSKAREGALSAATAGRITRAAAAHENGFEAFTYFAA